ncbi:MAG: hypothetical protein B7Z66_13615 [Chromatiales bacterium 21-64-14]|nr:MAG: hypothetical protein B7Z66_13615 [Chromatiales bacterium 21-64-14]
MKSVWLGALATSIALLLPISAQAMPNRALNPADLQAMNGIFIGGGVVHQHYTEWSRDLPNASTIADPLDQEHGNLSMFRILIAHRFPGTGGWGSIRYDFIKGHTDYIGHTQAGVPLDTTTANTMDDLRLRVGRPFALTDNLDLLPFLEGGYFRWDRAIGNGTPAALEELYTNGYAGGGARALYALSPRLVLSSTVDVGSIFAAGMEIINPLNGTTKLGPHLYAGLAFQATLRVYGHWHLFARAAYRYFGYGISNRFLVQKNLGNTFLQGVAYEPNSTTGQIRTAIGVSYHF